MSFAGKVWRLLVGIKDGMVLIFMLLFFMMLFAVLSSRPSPGMVRDGALLIELDGYLVEERSVIDPIDALLSQRAPIGEYEVSELVRAIDGAAADDRIKAVAIDLSRFLGGGQVHLQEVSDALARVRAADKPVYTFAFAYADDALQLSANATEIWADPLGGAIVMGPGGANLYFGDLLDRLDVNARVYRVGAFKAATEPYTRNSMSDEARANIGGLYGTLWEEWQANLKKARPGADLDRITSDPVAWIRAANGDVATAALDAGLIDKLGDRAEWGARVAEVAGEDIWSNDPGSFAHTELKPFLAGLGNDRSGKAIGIITVAGEIVDGNEGPSVAGGERIADLLDNALNDDLAALVVRVDSPGGSMVASEEIRRAIMRHKAKDIPVAISMGNLAASGGYYVATGGDRIFAEPETITGSIGVFAIIPTFEDAAARLGVNADGIRTTPLSGQPDIIGGFTPEVDAILQATVEDTYSDFLGKVAEARGISREEVDRIGQGQVWDGGTARQLGLVDQFGGLSTALEWAAKEAGLEAGGWHAKRLGTSETSYESLIRRLLTENSEEVGARADMFGMLARQRAAALAQAASNLDRLTGVNGVQAYCLECPGKPRQADQVQFNTWLTVLGGLLRP